MNGTFLVDPLISYPSRPFGHEHWCHLGTPDLSLAGLERLHYFAQAIGLRRTYFQEGRRHPIPHYDLTAGARRRAVLAGAEEVSRREWVRRMRPDRNIPPEIPQIPPS